MKPKNHTWILEFFLLGLSEQPKLKHLLYGLFSKYMGTILGNLFIILAMISNAHLHTPMYFFLSNLSFVTSV
jgi:olfactory receptor